MPNDLFDDARMVAKIPSWSVEVRTFKWSGRAAEPPADEQPLGALVLTGGRVLTPSSHVEQIMRRKIAHVAMSNLYSGHRSKNSPSESGSRMVSLIDCDCPRHRCRGRSVLPVRRRFFLAPFTSILCSSWKRRRTFELTRRANSIKHRRTNYDTKHAPAARVQRFVMLRGVVHRHAGFLPHALCHSAG